MEANPNTTSAYVPITRSWSEHDRAEDGDVQNQNQRRDNYAESNRRAKSCCIQNWTGWHGPDNRGANE